MGNFFVDFKSLFALVYFGTREEEQVQEPRALMRQLFDGLVSRGSLTRRPKILHWPGGLRKPWQRILPRVQSPWDATWWQAHDDMCKANPGVSCRLACHFRNPARAALRKKK